jgi:RsiW-degrading membrane proteinase PrsW (M82 family)
MSLLDSQMSENHPPDDFPPAAVPPAEWSARARGLLLAAKVIGLLIALIGLGLFLGTPVFSTTDQLTITIGLYLLPIGAGLVYVATRTEELGPNQRLQPGELSAPRKWFILIWIAGVLASFFLKIERVGDYKPLSAIAMLLALALMLSGGLWWFRWLTNKIEREWPAGRSDQPAAVPLRWPPSWRIGWAVISGALSAVLATGLEVLAIVLVAPLLTPLFESMSFSLTTESQVASLLRNPLIVLLIFLAASVAAPLIEEFCKGLTLWLFPKSVQRPLDGFMFGLIAGLGFGMVESGAYLTDLSLWFLIGWLRLGTLLLHGTTTSIIGLSYARSQRLHRRGLVLAGYGRGMRRRSDWA